MDDPNITIEEYIRLEEEKARRQGRTFDWQTSRYGKMEYYENEDDSFMNLETKYLAIVFDDISDVAFSHEPTVSPLDNNEIDFNISFDEFDDEDYMIVFDENSFSCTIISVDNLKMDSENENDKINIPSSPSPEPTIGYFNDLDFFKYFENEFPAIVYNDLKSKSDPLNEPSAILDIGRRLGALTVLSWVEVRAQDRILTRGSESYGVFGLHCWRFSGCVTARFEKVISSDRDFLGPAPSYVYIRDPVRRLCPRMIACSISGRGQGAEKYLFRCVERRKSGDRLFEGYFIGCLAAYFGLVGDQGLRAGALRAVEDAPIADKGAQVVPAPVQAPQPPPPAPQPHTMSQRIDRLEEEVRELRQSVVGLRGVVESSITEHTRVSTWMISCMTQLMDASGRTYQAFNNTLVGSSRLSCERHVRPSTGDVSTSAAPQTDDPPNP
ncbi:hypothetical protein Tco_1275226 [Tanacetum coccineum]